MIGSGIVDVAYRLGIFILWLTSGSFKTDAPNQANGAAAPPLIGMFGGQSYFRKKDLEVLKWTRQ